jgi:hypothetical protein
MPAGHGWALARDAGDGLLVSDPDGRTIEGLENRNDTPMFSLKMNTRGYVRFKARFQHNGSFQVVMRDGNGRAATVAELSGTNPSWPALDCVETPIPKGFIGQDAVQLSLIMVGGTEGGAGAAIDNLRIAARSCAAGSLFEGAAPPVLKSHRAFSIGPCPADDREPIDEL